jgi:DNA-directed RNA polymerase subunit F
MAEDGKFVSLADALKMLEKETEKRELGYEQKLAFAHAQQFSKMNIEMSEKLRAELMKMGHMTESLAYKIVEILPNHVDDIRVIFSKERHTLSPEEIEKILEAVRKYL